MLPPCPLHPCHHFPLTTKTLTQTQINLRPYLDLSTYPDEKEAESNLVAKMEKEKVYLTRGTLLQTEEIGWFRMICVQEDEVLEEGFKRLFLAIGSEKKM